MGKSGSKVITVPEGVINCCPSGVRTARRIIPPKELPSAALLAVEHIT